MRNQNAFDEITAAIRAALPSDLARDTEKKLRASLQTVFAKLDLITREELEVQAAVLQRTRERLEHLERLVAELERRLSKN